MTREEMLKIMIDITNKKEYQPGYPNANGRPSTHCNEAAIEIIETLGFDSSPFLNPKGIGWTNANDMYRNGWKAVIAGKLKMITQERAQVLSDYKQCVLVLAFSTVGGSGHVAVAAPWTVPYKFPKSLIIVQAGAKNGRFELNEIFNVSNLTAPMFIRCKKK